jgi:serine/threonine-protein kinase
MQEQTTEFTFPDSGLRSSFLDIPIDLLEKSRKRVQVVAALALLGFGLDVVIFLFGLLGQQIALDSPETDATVGRAIAVVASIAMILVARVQRLSHQTVLLLALLFEVVLCGIISITTPWSEYAETQSIPGLTWVTPLIIMFALLIPVRPKTTAVAALAAAATVPIGLLTLRTMASIEVTADEFVAATVRSLIAVIFATVASRVVYGLGLDVAKARQIGSYQLEEKLGAGGMGEVWKGRHRLLSRPAAIKLIHPRFSDRSFLEQDEILARFEREALATSRMRSPHTVQIYDFGRSNDGAFYYVMELLDGLDTEQFVRRFGPVEPQRLIHFLRQACDSLAEAHEQGLIHRDIKPANLYVCHYGRHVDFIKILDFGLVKSQIPLQQESAQLTAPTVTAGTPATMSPEQILGQPIDGRADLYGLGCVAFWLLTGRMVFEGSAALQVVAQHLHEAPTAPSQHSEFKIPAALDAVILACLEKDPANRPASADALEQTLASLQHEDDWSPERARQWWQMHGLLQPRSLA